MTYDPWKRVDELERRVAELEAQVRLLAAQPTAHVLPIVNSPDSGSGTLHLPKGKH